MYTGGGGVSGESSHTITKGINRLILGELNGFAECYLGLGGGGDLPTTSQKNILEMPPDYRNRREPFLINEKHICKTQI